MWTRPSTDRRGASTQRYAACGIESSQSWKNDEGQSNTPRVPRGGHHTRSLLAALPRQRGSGAVRTPRRRVDSARRKANFEIRLSKSEFRRSRRGSICELRVTDAAARVFTPRISAARDRISRFDRRKTYFAFRFSEIRASRGHTRAGGASNFFRRGRRRAALARVARAAFLVARTK